MNEAALTCLQRIAQLILMLCLAGCATSPPSDIDDICAIFSEKRGWYEAAKSSRARWEVPISVNMAIIYQESSFVATAKPPRKKIFGFIPGPRPSNSYGYSQALEETWTRYQRESGNYGADRDDFDDAVDFVGWYNDQSNKVNAIAKDDAYRLYLAYHEGHGGYAAQSYRSKAWLTGAARKVEQRAQAYNQQLKTCVNDLESKGWLDWF